MHGKLKHSINVCFYYFVFSFKVIPLIYLSHSYSSGIELPRDDTIGTMLLLEDTFFSAGKKGDPELIATTHTAI